MNIIFLLFLLVVLFLIRKPLVRLIKKLEISSLDEKISGKKGEIKDILKGLYGSEDKIPQFRKDFLYGNGPKKLEDPVKYLSSEFDGNINDVPFIKIITEHYGSGRYSVTKSDIDSIITNINKLIEIGKVTNIPDSIYEGVFKSQTVSGENRPYVNIKNSNFKFYLQGLKELGYEKWWKYQTDEYIGYTKDELILLKGNPDHKIVKVSRGKKREEYFYDEYRNRQGNKSYKFRVVLIDGKVNGWNDIKN